MIFSTSAIAVCCATSSSRSTTKAFNFVVAPSGALRRTSAGELLPRADRLAGLLVAGCRAIPLPRSSVTEVSKYYLVGQPVVSGYLRLLPDRVCCAYGKRPTGRRPSNTQQGARLFKSAQGQKAT